MKDSYQRVFSILMDTLDKMSFKLIKKSYIAQMTKEECNAILEKENQFQNSFETITLIEIRLKEI